MIAVMGIEGKKNKILGTLFNHIPKKNHIALIPGTQFHPADLLPKKRSYYHYVGSMTIPPCTEDVHWNVLNSPIQVSRKQIEMFRKHYPNNYRPVQPLNGRHPANY